MSHVQFTAICCFAIVLLAVGVHSAQAATQAPLCQPGIVEEMPQHIKKVCMALENSDQLTSALKSYINNEASALVANSDDLMKNYNKRTDVDHVFLRFGKRR
ncbi:dromyosuppressin [Drosophila grimshawi]|uniref:GH18813 n=1 Tax=Drosophila grimshawi TaxID=7222 RepID=B4JFX5_DROGR|nr:dromyosuppressin [Drosophila grimshawi]EDV92514.1 GH18813 [Drosophila grimshawi]